MLSFDEVKQIRIVEVIGRYGVRLRFKGEWASAPCPLPTHKPGDKARTFTINLAQNYWRCWSESCNQNNKGKKGGDVINFVALMENCRERDSARKIADWYGLNGESTVSRIKIDRQPTKTAQHIAERPKRSETSHKNSLEPSTPAIAGNGYVHDAGIWLDSTLSLQEKEAFGDYRVRVKKALIGKIIESYKNGKAAPR